MEEYQMIPISQSPSSRRRSPRALIALCLTLLVLAVGVLSVAAAAVQITGSVGVSGVDPDASNGQWYLRYTGRPAQGNFSHAYQWGEPQILCTPDTTPTTLDGTLDVADMTTGDVAFIGLLDKGLLGTGVTGYQSGAYIYLSKLSATTVRVGPTDGNLGGEIVQIFQDITIPGDNTLDVSFTIDGAADPNTCANGPIGNGVGCLTLTVEGGTPMTDSYGNVESLNNSVTYAHDEFALGAFPGWDDFGTSDVDYDLAVNGCTEMPATATAATVSQPLGSTTAVPANVCAGLAIDNWSNNWFACDENSANATGGVAGVSGPGTPPLGTGSAQFTIAETVDGPAVLTPFESGLPLSQVTQLAYEMNWDGTSTSNDLINLFINIDYDLTDAAANWQGRLVWIAGLPGCNSLTADTWQPYNAMTNAAACWRQTGTPIVGGAAQAAPWPLGGSSAATWAQVLAAYPNAGIHVAPLGAIGFKLGSGQAATVAALDAFDFGTNKGAGQTITTFNFEPQLACTTVCYADAVNGNDANGGATPAQAKKTIQAAIDAVQPNGAVRVLPGSYDETAANRLLFNSTGPYTFGLFIADAKDGITIQGVTAADIAITDPALTEAAITTNATNNFGHSGIFVEGDDVTIAGLELGDNISGNNKTIEVLGDGFTFKDSFMNVSDGGSLYFGDFRYDSVNNISHIQSYTVDNNVFSDGSSVDISNGAGYTGPVAGRQITNNIFEFSLAMYTAMGDFSWPNISFNGNSTNVGWYLYPVGGAEITGNTFTNNAPDGRHIRTRGIADDSQFDWESYWNDNTFNKKVIVGPNLFDDVRSYVYTSGSNIYNDVRQIGAVIQPEVDHALTGDTVLVGPGTYPEQVTIPTSITFLGSGPANTFIQAPATMPNAASHSSIVTISGAGVSVDMSEFTVTGPGPTACGSIAYGIFVRDGAYANIHDNEVVDIRDQGLSGCQNGNAIVVGRSSIPTDGTADITDNVIKTYQKTGIIISGAGSSATIAGNDVLGDGPISYIAENGVQVSSGASAEINDNTISGHSYTGPNWSSAGMLLYGPGTTNTNGNTIIDNQVGVWIFDASGTHEGNTVSATFSTTNSPYMYGFIVDDPPPGRNPSPAEETAAPSLLGAPAEQLGTNGATNGNPVQVNVITGNTITSDNSPGSVGIETDAGYGATDIDLTVTKNIIHDWEYGVIVYECTGNCTATTFANVDINRNSIVGNSEFGVYAETSSEVTDATCNWWGDASGPSGEGPGSGDAISTLATFKYWLQSSNLDGPCTAPATNVCPVDPAVGALRTDVIGTGQRGRHAKLNLPNYQNVDALYAQMAGFNVGFMKYVRFQVKGSPYVQVNTPTSEAISPATINWWGADLTATVATPWVKGSFFWGKKGNKAPRALVLWPTYQTGNQTYANAFETFDDSTTNYVHNGDIDVATQTLSIPATQLPGAALTVNVALVDVDKDKRVVILTVEAGGVSQTRIIEKPNKKTGLNLETFVLQGLPAGTDEVTITLESPAVSGLYPFGGDSAAIIGASANYACSDSN
jgi:hypothetical protein